MTIMKKECIECGNGYFDKSGTVATCTNCMCEIAIVRRARKAYIAISMPNDSLFGDVMFLTRDGWMTHTDASKLGLKTYYNRLSAKMREYLNTPPYGSTVSVDEL